MSSSSSGTNKNTSKRFPTTGVNTSIQKNGARKDLSEDNRSNIREQLIRIQIDIDDRGKVCEILQSKINKQRSQLANVEQELREEYQSRLEVTVGLYISVDIH